MRFARRGFWHDEVIDFLAVLLGYARSFERSLEEFYERLLPFAQPFMALFDREKLPSRSALSRFLASMSLEATETLRTPVFPQSDTAVPLLIEQETPAWSLALMGRGPPARQRARRQAEELPTSQRRLHKVCAAFLHGAQARGGRPYAHRYLSLAHSYQWLGSFGNRGNGLYREELRRRLSAIGS